MEPLQIMYIIMFGVGFLFLMLSIFGGDVDGDIDLDISDGDLDISDAESGADSPSLISIRTLATLLLGFGGAGWVVMRSGGGTGSQILWGFIVGLVITGLYFLAMKGFYAMQGDSMISAASLIGKEANVTIPTTSTGVVQVKVSTNSGMKEYTAKEKNGKKLGMNDTVKITSVPMGSGILTVEKEG